MRTLALLALLLLAGCVESSSPQNTTVDTATYTDPEPVAAPAESPPEEYGTKCSLRSESLQENQRVRLWDCSAADGNHNGELDGCEGFQTRQLYLSGRVEAGTLRVRVYGDDKQVDRILKAGDSGSTNGVDLQGSAWTVSMERDADFDVGPGFKISIACYN